MFIKHNFNSCNSANSVMRNRVRFSRDTYLKELIKEGTFKEATPKEYAKWVEGYNSKGGVVRYCDWLQPTIYKACTDFISPVTAGEEIPTVIVSPAVTPGGNEGPRYKINILTYENAGKPGYSLPIYKDTPVCKELVDLARKNTAIIDKNLKTPNPFEPIAENLVKTIIQ